VFSERTPVPSQELLPTYSPQLHAIEECWSKVKAYVRQHEQRTQDALVQLMKHGVADVTVGSVADCGGWHRHVTRHLLNCVGRMPLE